MEVKIIELTKISGDHTCLICCRKLATIKMKINRLVLDDSVTSFSVCDEDTPTLSEPSLLLTFSK